MALSKCRFGIAAASVCWVGQLACSSTGVNGGSPDGGAALAGRAGVEADAGEAGDAIDSATLDASGDGGADADLDGASEDASIPADAASADAVGASVSDGGCGPSGGSLIVNGSFECPAAPAGSYHNYAVGSAIDGWSVVGAGSVSTLSGMYVSGAYKWPAEDGSQTLDLTGLTSNSATGVSQTVGTTTGTIYHLSFWVGNIDESGTNPEWGSTSTVNVFVNGTMVLAATNSGGAGATTLFWQQFTLQFMATSSSTTIEFSNGDPSTDNSNILDDVVLN